jgi:hypothetical protein
MPSVFATRFVENASPRLRDHLGEVVTISRGASSTAGVTATWLSEGSEIQTQTRLGVKTSFIDREWVIPKANYLIDGSAVTPASGDRLTDTDSTVWEVMAQPNMPAFESYLGGWQWILRTKRI